MLIKEAIARALKDIGVSSDDSSIGSRYAYMALKSVRSELLRQEVEKKGLTSNFTLQTLKRFPLSAVDIAETQGFTAGETILRSDIVLPELMDTKDGKVIGGVFLPTGERLALTSYTATINSLQRRYRSTQPQVFIRDNRLYVRYYHTLTPKLYVDIDGLYENPEEVDRLNAADCNPEDACVFYPDLPFYLPGYLEGRFFRIVKQDLIGSLGIPKDKANNGTEDLQGLQQQRQPQNQ